MNEGIFSKSAPLYWGANLPVMPLKVSAKVPIIASWQDLCSRMPADDEQAAWLRSYPGHNIGLPLGKQSGLCMIDIDTDDQSVIDIIKSLLPETPWSRRGKKGMALAFKWKGQPNCKIKGTDGSMLVELLGAGNQLVLPPSVHPDTGLPYVATSNLWEVVAQIPELPANFEAMLRAELCAAGFAIPSGRQPAGQRVSGGVIKVEIPSEHGIARFIAQAAQAACDEIVAAKEGSRNTTLFGQAKDLARHVAGAEQDWSPFAALLETAGIAAGLKPAEVSASIASGWAAGSIEPTEWIPIAAAYVYLGAQDQFFHPASGAHLTQSGFNGVHGRIHGGSGTFASFLLSNGYITKVQDITYTPKQPTGILLKNENRFYNTYRPSSVLAEDGDPTPFVEFLQFLIPSDEEREHLVKMMAHSVRKPGERISHALILRTLKQGVGKSLLFTIWSELVGKGNVRHTSSREMSGNFEGWMKENVLLICPELNIGSGLSTYNELKELITAEELTINEKHLRPRRWEIFSTMVFSTNLEVPLLVEPDDRRIFFIDSPALPRPEQYYTAFAAWADAHLGVIRNYLDAVDLSQFNPRGHAPMTEAKQRLIGRSAKPITQDLAFLIRQRTGKFDRDVVTLGDIRYALNCGDRMSDRALATALKELGAHSLGQVRVPHGRESLWIVRNVGIWKAWSVAECVEEFNRPVGVLAPFDHEYIGLVPMRAWPSDVPLPSLQRAAPLSDGELANYLLDLLARQRQEAEQLPV